MPKAKLKETEHGLVPEDDGWLVANACDAPWLGRDRLRTYSKFETEGARFPDFGFNVNVIDPGQPSCMYHGEAGQEAFLILSGECILLVEGEERLLRAWDFVHLPPWTEHALVGAGDGPCVFVAVGRRHEPDAIRYTRPEIALKYGAAAEEETDTPAEAYARFSPTRERASRAGDLPAW